MATITTYREVEGFVSQRPQKNMTINIKSVWTLSIYVGTNNIKNKCDYLNMWIHNNNNKCDYLNILNTR